MESYDNLAAHRKMNFVSSWSLTGLALLVTFFTAANIKGCSSALDEKENPYGIVSKIGYDFGEEIINGGKDYSFTPREEQEFNFPGQDD